jgi:hypothetical protein
MVAITRFAGLDVLRLSGDRQKGTVVQETPTTKVRQSIPARAGAAGKAFIVYLASGSVGLALVAFLLFKGMGC